MAAGILGALLGLLICILVTNAIASRPQYSVTYEPLSDEEEKTYINARVNLINNLKDTVSDAWDVVPEKLNENAELLPNDTTLVTIIYRHLLLRFYLHWNTNTMDVNLIDKDIDKSHIHTKTFVFNGKHVFEKVYKYLEKYKPASEQQPAVNEEIIEKLTTVISTVVDMKVEEKLKKMIAELEEKEKEQDHE